jgi:outer membrane lipoprotein-sorting protein
VKALKFLFPLYLAIFAVQLRGQANAPDAHAILQRAANAMGCNTVTPVTNIVAVGHLQASGISAPMPLTIYSQGNSRWRSELDTPKEHKVTIVNNGKGQIQHADGRVTPLAEHNTSHQTPTFIPCLTRLALSAAAVDATYVRAETTTGDILDVVEVLPKNLSNLKPAMDRMKSTVWISRSTGYVTKLEYINASEEDSNETEPVDIEYFDYRVVGGLAVPFHQVTHAGDFSLDLLFDSVQLNTPAADFSLR